MDQQEEQSRIRARVVAAGILTEEEANRYVHYKPIRRSQLPPGVVIPDACPCCGKCIGDQAKVFQLSVDDAIKHKAMLVAEVVFGGGES